MTRRATPGEGEEVDQWVREPLYWAKRFLGPDFDPWSGQEELWAAYGKVLNAKLKRYQLQGLLRRGELAPPSVEAHMTPDELALSDKMGISVMSGHGTGKERSVTGIALHYLSVLAAYKPGVVCTAPAGTTLRSTLWKEFAKVIANSPTLSALFEVQSNRIYLKNDPAQGKDMRIEPRTIQQNSDERQQGEVLAGIHAIGVLYIATEASGIADPVFRPIEGGLTDPLSMILLIFNPTKRTGFAAESHLKNRAYWVCLQWDGRTLKREKLQKPGHYTWYNERAQDILAEKYGEDSDTFRTRVIGTFPQQSADTLIHYDAVMSASERQIELHDSDPICIGVDVGGGGEGGDPSIIAVLRGPKLVKLEEHHVKEARLADLIALRVSEEVAGSAPGTQVVVGVDYVGIGRTVYNLLTEWHRLAGVEAVDVSELPIRTEEFPRLRDEVWWELREAFMQSREIVLDPSIDNYDELVAQLTSIKWGTITGPESSKIKIQGKDSSGLPGVPPLTHSPNEADAVGLAWRMYRHHCSRVPLPLQRRRGRQLYRRQPVSLRTL